MIRKYGTPLRNPQLEECIELTDEDLMDIEDYVEILRKDLEPKIESSLKKLEKFVKTRLGYRVRTASDKELRAELLDFIQRNWIEPTLEELLNEQQLE